VEVIELDDELVLVDISDEEEDIEEDETLDELTTTDVELDDDEVVLVEIRDEDDENELALDVVTPTEVDDKEVVVDVDEGVEVVLPVLLVPKTRKAPTAAAATIITTITTATI